MSIPDSLTIPSLQPPCAPTPCPPPPVTISSFSKSVSLFLFCKYVHLYHFFLDSAISDIIQYFSLSVWLTSLSKTLSRCGPLLKSFIEFVTILLLFYVLVFWPWGMWDLNSLTRDPTRTPCIGRRSLNHWTAREVPPPTFELCHPLGYSPCLYDWSFAPAILRSSSWERERGGLWPWSSFWLRSCTRHFHSCSFGKNLVKWSYITAKEA